MKIKAIPFFFVIFAFGISCQSIKQTKSVSRVPTILPDYTEIVIPPNIAPLCFSIQEKGLKYFVEIRGENGKPIHVRSRNGKVHIPIKPWKKLLDQNRGKEIRLFVSVLDSHRTRLEFQPIVQYVAREEIDPYLVYRRIPPLYILWKKIRICERNLENFNERTILWNKPMGEGCLNCHSFLNYRPEHWLVQLRKCPGTGFLLIQEGNPMLVDPRTERVKSPAVYPAWHPSGKYIAFSVNKVRQFFHLAGENRDVIDLVSDLVLYHVDKNTLQVFPALADPSRLETYPHWSPDGKFLYFCSAPGYDTTQIFTQAIYKKIRYDLMRVPFDPETGTLGQIETVLSSEKMGASITHPRISPDGRFLLFCMCNYGNFSIYQPSSDLYLMDLKTKEVRALPVNSHRSESYHAWSSNGRWIVFSSKREDGLCARPYFSYVDTLGNASKPFVLPQRDPKYYEYTIETFNVPEFLIAPVQPRPQKILLSALRKNKLIHAKDQGASVEMPMPSSEESSWKPAPSK